MGALLLAAGCTRAQPFQVPATFDNPCGFAAPITRWPYTDLTPDRPPALAAAPAPIGTGTAPTIRWNAAGIVGWYHYPRADGSWVTIWGAETWASFAAHAINVDAVAVATAADPVAALNAIVAGRVNTPLADPSLTPVWCPYAREMIASQPPKASPTPDPTLPPGPPTWRTPPVGTGTLYVAAVGRLVSLVPGRKAPPNTPCDCFGGTAPTVSVGTNTYCPLAAPYKDVEAAVNQEVTLCKKTP